MVLASVSASFMRAFEVLQPGTTGLEVVTFEHLGQVLCGRPVVGAPEVGDVRSDEPGRVGIAGKLAALPTTDRLKCRRCRLGWLGLGPALVRGLPDAGPADEQNEQKSNADVRASVHGRSIPSAG